MHLKDYYSILELTPSATQQEIKKAYRLLALQYHPDKNEKDPYAQNRFAEIKEAYEVLTDPSKKEYYLQQRWYDQSTGKKKAQGVITPVTVLKQVLELERYVSKLDTFRMDKQGLHDYIMALVDDPVIEKLNNFNERDTNNEIVATLLQCLKPLPNFYLGTLHQQIGKIGIDSPTRTKLDQFLLSKQKAQQRDKFRIWILLLTVIVLCLLIFFAAN